VFVARGVVWARDLQIDVVRHYHRTMWALLTWLAKVVVIVAAVALFAWLKWSHAKTII
jgi:hypothetical protein